MMTGYGFNPMGMILSLVVWALIISGIVLLVVWLARNANRGTSFIGSGESALDILKKRYAKGEVTKEQFDAVKRDLEA
jgi:putative membrane protein